MLGTPASPFLQFMLECMFLKFVGESSVTAGTISGAVYEHSDTEDRHDSLLQCYINSKNQLASLHLKQSN